ncbi:MULTISPECIES: 3-hydroxyacyl-ACP dehydratase FabZ [Cycloclasticus]|jgi:3-hydroxyacyl-[acyl-carrier-protein] dehydratase|uniref:3-hydroxyacyl-[acyl-carrier-protein] dehydratase FabZ n=2 Tax=Cycloclasticus TaxID=34067 RepID=S5TGC4_9GAMM|nr:MULTISPECIES: 3-hydroxyacyl-ACP dehydratase FabZ [Cycloclasticus]AFT67059.1 Beta-hydroxyacyl-(Acyl-carrier-protein) dehydratase FabZ [Cycloclasticus sp. P1]AGS39902.1 3-hydroxyacyl-[acyl-carrier-protein] dehydratase [Cycloclasticus zancles 78-ME]ATI03338.1 3-hydroxyacyl-[acyl-carrier-protein] dehydratase FabZ [Cycloclasticus sp. PY97N]EPD12583.1 beta-hydroxyacyl-(Acyl-carrier-protein) dehydratase FabZ [Cycloclasticus pugetii]MBV1899010.1 3-hydroxyacyl-ACP dehydratase FabZ [Cycloclasticus sp|tara:strand:+ start:319 stop:768 length:450 start_codon:yes stop_codon:yes gene_type:complete
MSLDDVRKVMEFLPHRYPFLMIDRVVEYEAGERLLAVKNVTYNEPQFTGHFPHNPIMPGVLVIEALAQATGLLSMKTLTDRGEDFGEYYLVGIDKARFKRSVVPGDQLMIEAVFKKNKRNIWSFSASATVDGELVVSAEIMCASKESTK